MNKNKARDQAIEKLGHGGMYWKIVKDIGDNPLATILGYHHTLHDLIAHDHMRRPSGEKTLMTIRRVITPWGLRLGLSRSDLDEALGPSRHVGNGKLLGYLQKHEEADLYQACLSKTRERSRAIQALFEEMKINDLRSLLGTPYLQVRLHFRRCILKELLPFNLNLGMTEAEIRLALDPQQEEAR